MAEKAPWEQAYKSPPKQESTGLAPWDEDYGGKKSGVLDKMESMAQGYKSAQDKIVGSVGEKFGPILRAGAQAYEPYRRSSEFSPQGLILKGEKLVRSGFDRAGEVTAETFAKQGIDPRISAMAGTAVQMYPDIVEQSMVPGLTEGMGKSPRRLLRKMARPASRRALGLTKQHLKTQFARGKAQQAADIASEQDIFSITGSPDKALRKVEGLKQSTGQRIGKILKDTSVKLDDAVNDLQSLKSQMTMGTEGGIFKSVGGAVDDVIATVRQLAKGGELSAKTLSEVRKRISKSINFLSDLASQADNKALQGEIKNIIRKSVQAVQSPEVARRFIGDNKLYESYQLMIKGLNNELAAQMGNRAIGLDTAVLGAGQLATGSPGQAMGALGLLETLKRRGAGASSRILNEVGKGLQGATRGILQAGPQANKIIGYQSPPSEQEVRDYLKRANGDPDLARQLFQQENPGREIPE